MKHLVFLTLLLATTNLSAQTYFFNRISQEDGLRNGNVRAIIKDHQGFMWFGTEDGLHRYDGYAMKVYRHKPEDSTSIGSNFILCLYEDSYDNLWIGTLGGGLYLYDRKNDSFKSYHLTSYSNDHVAVRSITQGKDDFLYIGSDNLFRAKIDDPDLMVFKKVPLPSDTVSTPGIRITAIRNDMDSNLLVSINTVGLFSFDVGLQKSQPDTLLLEKNIQTLYVDRIRKLIWVGTWGDGLIVYDPAKKRLKRISKGPDQRSLRNNFVPSIAGDSFGNIWIATDNGLSLVPPDSHPLENDNIITFQTSTYHPTGLNGNIIKFVYADDEERVWIGTYYEGVNVYNRHSMNFGAIVIRSDQMDYGNITVCVTDENNNLWLGLDGGGLYTMKWDIKKHNISSPQSISATKNDKIKSMTMGDDQNLWIGTWGKGLLKFNCKTKEYTNVPDTTLGNYIIALDTDKSQNLWIGSFDKGIFQYDLANNKITKLASTTTNPNRIDRVNTILVDREENVWIGKEVGGLHFLPKGDTIYTSVITNDLDLATTIYAIYQDKSGILWLGAPALGLIKYDPVSNESFVYGEDHGLQNNSIYAIEEDEQGRLWISHNAGISVFDIQTEYFTDFTTFNGLTSNQFNKNSSVKLDNGYIAFGNIKGLNYFNPEEYQPEKKPAPIVFTNLWVNNIEQEVDGKVLDENITTIRTIHLSHNQNSFGIEFSELDYNFSTNTDYQYILERFDKSWQNAGNRRLISYTNLPPGKYTFKIRSANKETSGNNQLSIIISPAWWQTNAFKVALVLILVLSALSVHRARTRFLVKQRRILENQVSIRTRKLNEANDNLNSKIEEINSMNNLLQKQHSEIREMNNEILAQNEELQSQNEQINMHRDKLEEVNSHLEELVSERTEKLRHTITELSKTIFELDRFVYSASHDLSAPLKSIHGLVKIMSMENDPARLPECIERIGNTVNKLEVVIRNMVNYSRNSHSLIKPEGVNLKELINEVISELEFWKKGSELKFYNSMTNELIVHTDRFRMKVILSNLVSNAVKFSDKNKPDRWIKFDGNLNRKSCHLKITDNGIGIQDIYMEKIFDMYFRGTEASDGSGLGLFIVKEMLEKINGSIDVKSEFGNFTSVELNIPSLKNE